MNNYGFIIICIYFLLGIICIVFKKELPRIYITILFFFSLKIIINYRQCTVGYLECKLRGVEKEEGYLNQFMDLVIDIRYTNHVYYLLIVSFVILYYDLICLNNIKYLKQKLKGIFY